MLFCCCSVWVLSIVLSSTPLMHSSRSLSLPFILSSVFLFQLLHISFSTGSLFTLLGPYKILTVFIIPFCYSFSFITTILNYLSCKLFISVSLLIFLRSSLSVETSAFAFSFCFSFFYLYKFRWNSYLLWSWRIVLMWDYHCKECLYPVPLIGELDWM